MNTGDFIMPFGKHKGKPLSDVPTDYLSWVLGLDDLLIGVKDAVLAHLQTRADWLRQDDD